MKYDYYLAALCGLLFALSDSGVLDYLVARVV